MLRHYVDFLYAGEMFTDHLVVEVADRDPLKVTFPTRGPLGLGQECFGYCFFDREVTRNGVGVVAEDPKNYSGIHYFGRVIGLDEFTRLGTDQITLNLVKEMGWDKFVRTRCGTFQPFREHDTIVAER